MPRVFGRTGVAKGNRDGDHHCVLDVVTHRIQKLEYLAVSPKVTVFPIVGTVEEVKAKVKDEWTPRHHGSQGF